MTVHRRGSKARFTLRTASYVEARTWTYAAVSRCKLTQNTADADYVLLTIVVNGHNCVAIRHQRIATCHELDLSSM